MNNMERFHFVMWAVDNFPRFTTNPGEYEAATRAWEQYKNDQHLVSGLQIYKQGAQHEQDQT